MDVGSDVGTGDPSLREKFCSPQRGIACKIFFPPGTHQEHSYGIENRLIHISPHSPAHFTSKVMPPRIRINGFNSSMSWMLARMLARGTRVSAKILLTPEGNRLQNFSRQGRIRSIHMVSRIVSSIFLYIVRLTSRARDHPYVPLYIHLDHPCGPVNRLIHHTDSCYTCDRTSSHPCLLTTVRLTSRVIIYTCDRESSHPCFYSPAHFTRNQSIDVSSSVCQYIRFDSTT